MDYPDFLTVIKLSTCDSTNNYIKSHYKSFQHQFPILVTAKNQTRGRGRENRHWFSAHQAGLYSSFGYHLKNKNNLNLLSLISGIAVVYTLRESGEKNFKIKWPNDVLHLGKKVSGILTETIITNGQIISISGIGINVNHNLTDFPEELKSRASSLKMITGKEFDIESIKMILANNFFYWLQQLESNQNEAIIQKLNRLSYFSPGETICIKSYTKEIKGTYESIDDDGGIIIADQEKNRKTYYSGEIQID